MSTVIIILLCYTVTNHNFSPSSHISRSIFLKILNCLVKEHQWLRIC
uniref:Uncharacterized protein n=1 Tax=Arundo donax TaxID=35708 RepID=A0A0A9BVE2_ARUDO